MAVAWQERDLALKAMSFGLIGVINTAIDVSLFFLALTFVTRSLVIANVMAWLIAVSCSYVMNCHITFAHESGGRLRLRDYATFLAFGLVGLAANTLVLLMVAKLAPVLVAKACAILASFLVNFSLTNFVVFRKRLR